MKKLLLIALTFALTSCLSPVNTDPAHSYLVTRMPAIKKESNHGNTIMVMQPETRPIYSSKEMAYMSKPYQIAYYAQNSWAETPTQMLQPLIIQSLQNTNYFRAVLSPPYIGKYQYVLSTQLLDFKQNFVTKPHVFELTLRADLNVASTGRLIATKEWNIKIPIRAVNPYAGVVAANIATAAVLHNITKFCVENAT